MTVSTEIKNILTNTGYLYLVQGFNYLLPLLILPYLIKTLSVDSFGIYTFAFAFSQFILLIVDFGFNISATKKIAENSTDELFVKNLFWVIIAIKLFLSVISLLITGILIVSVPQISFYSDAILWSFLMVLGTIFFPLWWFQGLNRMKEMSVINAISKLLTYPLIFIFVKKYDDYNSAIIIQSMSYLLASIFSVLFVWKTKPRYFVNCFAFSSKKTYWNEIKDSFGIFLSNSSISLYTNSLTIILGFFSSNYNVGLFGAMERISRVICFGVLGPINQACFPVIVKIKKENFAKAKKVFRIILIAVFVVMCLAYFIFYIFTDWILERFLKGYYGVEGILNIFMLMIFPIALGGVLGNLGLLGLGGEKEKKIFSKIYIRIGVLSLPISIVFIKYFDLYGTIAAMLIVEILIFIMMLFNIIKRKFI